MISAPNIRYQAPFLAISRIGLALLLLVGSASLLAQNITPGFVTLNGIGSIAVEIDGVHRDFARFGLTSTSVRQHVVDQLSNSGITITKTTDFNSEPDAALMRIKIRTNENQYRFYHYGVSLDLIRKIPLNNPAGGFVPASSWRQGQTGIVMPTELRKLNGIIATLLGEFITDFNSQNGSLSRSDFD